MRFSDWSAYVCCSDLPPDRRPKPLRHRQPESCIYGDERHVVADAVNHLAQLRLLVGEARQLSIAAIQNMPPDHQRKAQWRPPPRGIVVIRGTGEQAAYHAGEGHRIGRRSEERRGGQESVSTWKSRRSPFN